MIPHERSLVKKLENAPFALIGVNSDSREAYDAEVEEMGVTWRSFMEKSTSGPIPTKWNISGWPTIYIIDVNGVIRFKNLRDEAMEEAVMELLSEAKAQAKTDS
ncbi:MAG: hypothetical protein O7G85_09805 [Planctomycetota bacterium]|nr:hypothetical protein [Planctomycetota bacterium]